MESVVGNWQNVPSAYYQKKHLFPRSGAPNRAVDVFTEQTKCSKRVGIRENLVVPTNTVSVRKEKVWESRSSGNC